MSNPPLSPRGTARTLFEPDHGELVDALRRASSAHDLRPEDLFIADELLELSPWLPPAHRRALGFAVLASLAAANQGSTRLPLGGGARGSLGRLIAPLIAQSGLRIGVGAVVKDIGQLATQESFARLFGRPGDSRPFIVADDCLYQHRHYVAETELSTRLGQLYRAAGYLPSGAPVAKLGAIELDDVQASAVKAAVENPLTVISGGPGTGKTAVIAGILRTAMAAGTSAAGIVLAAPTGKAAQRIGEAIGDLAETPGLDAPTTLHRVLGYDPRRGLFRHHENYPIKADLIVVDEASMLGLDMANALFRASFPHARIVLIGDADQLPSVDAGAVLRDLVVTGQSLGAGKLSVVLDKNYRMATDDGGRDILSFAGACRAGDPTQALASAQPTRSFHGQPGMHIAPGTPALELEQCWLQSTCLPDQTLCDAIAESNDGALQDDGSIRELIDFHARAQLLTATRKLATGATQVNARLHASFQRARGNFSDFVPGEPIIARTNDYRRGLWNGDLGVIVRVRSKTGEVMPRAVFRAGAELRAFSIDSVRGVIEHAFALTVHQSQGSEWPAVLMVLPGVDMPLLTRELIYTGVTRARTSACIAGPRAVVERAIRRSTVRTSGIPAALLRELL